MINMWFRKPRRRKFLNKPTISQGPHRVVMYTVFQKAPLTMTKNPMTHQTLTQNNAAIGDHCYLYTVQLQCTTEQVFQLEPNMHQMLANFHLPSKLASLSDLNNADISNFRSNLSYSKLKTHTAYHPKEVETLRGSTGHLPKVTPPPPKASFLHQGMLAKYAQGRLNS